MTSVCFLAVVFFAFIGSVVSQGSPGEFCGGRVYCLKGQARCDANRTCVCNNPPYTRGPRGDLGCYAKNQVRTEVFNDPTLSTFSEEDVRFQYPCRYLLTAVRQQLKKKNGLVIGNCTFQIHAFQGRGLGKFYVEGIEIAIQLNYNNGNTKAISSIVWGTKGNVQAKATDGAYLPDATSYGTDTVNYVDLPNGITIKAFFNPDTQQYVYEALACGLRTTFVPYDLTAGINSPYVPGVTAAINCAYHPVFLFTNLSMGLDPKNNVSTVLAQYPGLNAQEAFLVRAFTRDIPQTQPNPSPLCSAVSTSLSTCSAAERDTALNVCSFVFDAPRFIRCVAQNSVNSDPVIDIFNRCVRSICNSESQCSPIQALVPPACQIAGGASWNLLFSSVCP